MSNILDELRRRSPGARSTSPEQFQQMMNAVGATVVPGRLSRAFGSPPSPAWTSPPSPADGSAAADRGSVPSPPGASLDSLPSLLGRLAVDDVVPGILPGELEGDGYVWPRSLRAPSQHPPAWVDESMEVEPVAVAEVAVAEVNEDLGLCESLFLPIRGFQCYRTTTVRNEDAPAGARASAAGIEVPSKQEPHEDTETVNNTTQQLYHYQPLAVPGIGCRRPPHQLRREVCQESDVGRLQVTC